MSMASGLAGFGKMFTYIPEEGVEGYGSRWLSGPR